MNRSVLCMIPFPAAAALLCLPASASPPAPPRMSFLDNGVLRVGVDLDRGGSIGFLAEAGNASTGNLINIHDLGRWVGQSYYSGPAPFGRPHPAWKDWPWNPVSAGDVYGRPSRLLEHSNDGRTLYVKAEPKQWALDGVAADCTFETWIRLEGNVVRVRNRLTNRRTDRTRHPARDQELPALYTVGRLHRLVTYDGRHPFTGGPLRVIENHGQPWARWEAAEHWAALLGDDDRGVGVCHPGVVRFLGGFHGRPRGRGGPTDDATGYLSPVRREILDHDIVYGYEYALVVGSLQQIREWAYEHRPAKRPDWRFGGGTRHGWTYVNASDDGPPAGAAGLRMSLDRADPQALSPETAFAAADAPRLYVRAAFRTSQSRAALHWRFPGEAGFPAARRLVFPVVGDGAERTYEIPLAGHPEWRGLIGGLRLDPTDGGSAGDTVVLRRVSAGAD